MAQDLLNEEIVMGMGTAGVNGTEKVQRQNFVRSVVVLVG